MTTDKPTDRAEVAMELERCHAAIEILKALSLSMRTLRRGTFLPGAKSRMGTILRLSEEAIALLREQIATVEKTATEVRANRVAHECTQMTRMPDADR